MARTVALRALPIIANRPRLKAAVIQMTRLYPPLYRRLHALVIAVRYGHNGPARILYGNAQLLQAQPDSLKAWTALLSQRSATIDEGK